MLNLQNFDFQNPLLTGRRYQPATLIHNCEGWYVEFYIQNPMLETWERRRTYLNNIRRKFRTTAEFRMYANDIVCDLNIRLASGWSPWDSKPETARSFNLLSESIDKFIDTKSKELRDASLRSYKSFCSMYKKWMEQHYKGCKSGSVTKEMALEYIEDMADKQEWSNRTFNNNVKQGRALFSWLIKNCYASVNPFETIETKRVQAKKRTIIPADAQKLIDDWFAKNNPAMRIIMRLVYTSLLRPIEISRVQVDQIDFEKHCIHMPGDKTKNWRPRDARMDEELEELLRKHIEGAKSDDFLFANRQWKCGKKSQGSISYAHAWDKMRASLVDADGEQILPDSYQLYSLKDTSITGMIKGGIDDLSVMQAAGHHELGMTLIYADHTDEHLINNLNKKAPKFAN